MNELYATINFSKQKFILNGVDLISGDYNSTKIKFTFEDNQDKTKVIEIRPANSEDKNPTFMATITNNEVILTSKDEEDHNVTPFTTGGVYYMEISAYSNDSKLSTITKSFNVLEEQIILSDEIVSPYLPVFDELIEEIIRVTNEASNVNIDVTKNNNITTVTITNRDGVVKTVQILDGKDGIDGKDGEDGGGIESIEKISTVGLVDTYRITLTNNEYYDYEITNGNGIVSIEKTGTVGNIDTYTITYSDGTTSTFTVTNSEVTNEEFEELQSQVNELSLYVNALPKVTGTGTEITLNYTAKSPMPMSLAPSATSQASTTGKNLFQIKNADYVGQEAWSAYGGENYDKLENGYKMNTGYVALGFQYDNLEVGQQYTISFDAICAVSSNTVKVGLNVYRGSTQTSSSKTYSVSTTSVRINWTFTADTTNRIAFNSGTTSGTVLTITNIQLEKGSTATDYEPYTGGIASPNPSYPQSIHTVSGDNTITISNSDNTQSQTLPLNLGTIELCKIGDYEDYFYKDSDKWYLHKEIGKHIFSNKDQIIVTGSNFYTNITPTPLHYLAYMNTYLYDNRQSGFNNMPIYHFGFEGNGVMHFKNTDYTTGSALLQNLINTNSYLIYILKVTTDTEITDTTLIEELEAIYNKATSYQEQTNITQVNNDLPFVITASAIYDLSNLLN